MPKNSKSKNTIRSIARKEVKKELKKTTELKYYDAFYPNLTASTDFIPIEISDVPSGHEEGQRVGTEIIPKNLRINFSSRNFVDVHLCRLIVFTWNDDVNPTLNQILPVAEATFPYNHINKDYYNCKQGYVLVDKMWEMNTVSAGGDAEIMFRTTKRLVGTIDWTTQGRFSGAHGRIFYVALTNSDVNPPITLLSSRITYTDS